MAINSKKKGAQGEREFSKWLFNNLQQYSARRGIQFSGSADSPDVTHDIHGIHFEVKRVERLNLEQAMKQAIKDSEGRSVPVVAHRKNRGDWHMTIRADDLSEFVNNLFRWV